MTRHPLGVAFLIRARSSPQHLLVSTHQHAQCVVYWGYTAHAFFVVSMPKTYHFNAKTGHSKHSGLNPFEAKRDADDFNALLLEPGDRVLFRGGQTFEGTFAPKRSGESGKEIAIDTYTLNGDPSRWANFTGDPSATYPIAWDVYASHLKMGHLTAQGARYAGFVFREQHAHVDGVNLRMRDCGIGARLRGSHVRLTHADAQGGTMSRYERKVTDEGGVAFSIEADGWLNEHNVIDRAYVQGAVAAEDEVFDGGGIEIFGDIKDLTVQNSLFLYSKGGVEVGGPTRKTGTPSLAKDITFSRNVFIHPAGILVEFNHPSREFPIRVQNMVFDHNTIYDRTRNRSAVWFPGNWGDLSGVLTLTDNVYSGLGSWLGTNDSATRLNTVIQRGNVIRSVSDPSIFMNEAYLDLRLKAGTDTRQGVPGALGVGVVYASEVDLKWLLKQTRTPLDANQFVGGLHSYPHHAHMWAIPKPLRKAGMECAVSAFDQRWRLDTDEVTWLQN